MTLTEALRRLHEQGRIRSAWLPGMLYARTNGPSSPMRVGDPRPDLIDLPNWSPVLTDPATVGCILALLEGAIGHPIELHLCGGPDGCGEWFVWVPVEMPDDQNEIGPGGKSRGEAIANALIALAGDAQ